MKRLAYIFTLIFFLAFSVNIYSQGLIKTVVAVTGNVIDQVTKEPVAAKITVYDLSGKKVNSTKSNSYEDGYYYVTALKAGTTYEFVIENENYLIEKVNVKIVNTDRYEEISRDFTVKPNEIGKRIQLPVSPFEINKFKLRFGSEIILDDLAKTLKSNSDVKFKIISFPDKAGESDNKLLTNKRSQSLMDYFVIKGINPDRIQIEGSSETDKLNPPPSEKQSKGKRYIGPTYIEIVSK